jgi:rod shape-determining protein MreB
MDEAIIAFLRREHNLAIGERTAEEIKLRVGSAHPSADGGGVTLARGRDLYSGLPRSVEVRAGEIREAIAEPVREIVETIKFTLEDTPPELAGDIMEQGILLTGGGCLLRGLGRLLEEETKMPTRLPEDPLTCVVLGAGRALEELDSLRKVVDASRW